MEKINILVVEDEHIVAKDIEQSLKRLGYNVPGMSSTGEDAIQKAEELNPDLILMDIMLKGEMTGIEAANHILENLQIPIIYLTAYADQDTLKKAKITEPYGYILKPFKEIDLQTNIEIALYKHKQESKVKNERDLYFSVIENKSSDGSIFVKSNGLHVKIKTKDLFFVEGLRDYAIFNTTDKRYTIHATLKKIEEKLPSQDFLRIHKSYIVRIDKINAIEHSNIIIEHDKKYIPIGNFYKKKLMSRLKVL